MSSSPRPSTLELMGIRFRLGLLMQAPPQSLRTTGLISLLGLTVRAFCFSRSGAQTECSLTRHKQMAAAVSQHPTMDAIRFGLQPESWIPKALLANSRELQTNSLCNDAVSLLCGSCPRPFDMPVFFGRDLSRFSDFISAWYGSSPLLRAPSQVCFRFRYQWVLRLPAHTDSCR